MIFLPLLLACGQDAATPAAGPDGSPPEPVSATAPIPMPDTPQLHPHTRVVTIPAGPFIMGTTASEEEVLNASYGLKKTAYAAEEPKRRVELPEFRIDRYEVSMLEFKRFVEQTGGTLPPQVAGIDMDAYPGYPMSMVTWDEANAYCAWKGARLPTEAEWEKAARGTDARRFPWGNDYDATKANHSNEGINASGYFPGDVSPYGVNDMAGNVSEWTADWYGPYPGNDEPDRDYGETHRVTRGGNWGGLGHYNLSYYARAAYREAQKPEARWDSVGFRCAWDAEGNP